MYLTNADSLSKGKIEAGFLGDGVLHESRL